MNAIRYSTQADIDLMNAAAQSIAARLSEAGIEVRRICAAQDNSSAGIDLSEEVMVVVSEDNAYVSQVESDGTLSLSLEHWHDDVAGLIQELRAR